MRLYTYHTGILVGIQLQIALFISWHLPCLWKGNPIGPPLTRYRLGGGPFSAQQLQQHSRGAEVFKHCVHFVAMLVDTSASVLAEELCFFIMVNVVPENFR